MLPSIWDQKKRYNVAAKAMVQYKEEEDVEEVREKGKATELMILWGVF